MINAKYTAESDIILNKVLEATDQVWQLLHLIL